MKAALHTVFFLSGAAALVFEALWFRQALLSYGEAALAATLVLTVSAAGLAIGSTLAARIADRSPDPVRTFATVDAVIGATGIAAVMLLPYLGSWLTPLLRPLVEPSAHAGALPFAIDFALLLPTTTAIGVTLPLMTRMFGRVEPRFGAVLGSLHGWTLAGAATGVVVTEGYLVEAFGIRAGALAGGAVALAAAALALWVSNRIDWPMDVYTTDDRVRWRRALPWTGAAVLAGFAMPVGQLAWFRFLLLYVPDPARSFAWMLAVVLAGVALGAWTAAATLRHEPLAHEDAFAVLFRAAAAALLSYAALPLFLGRDGPGSAAGELMLALTLMLPASFFSGMFFTLAGASLRNAFPSETSTTALLTLAHATGAMLGALAAGYVLLPRIGSESSLFVCAVVFAGAGLLLARVCRPLPGSLVFPVGLFAAAAVFFPFGAMTGIHVQSRSGVLGEIVAEVREGPSETIVYVQEESLGQPWHFAMLTNGEPAARSSVEGRRAAKLCAWLPIAVHPRIRSALLLGYGMGQTARALTDSEGIETIDIVDPSRDALEMHRDVFDDAREPPSRDPRVDVHIMGGRSFLRASDRSFDLITGEPPSPVVAGAAHLYSREFFELLRARLAGGGIVAYRLPIDDLSNVGSKAILRSFCDVFADCQLYHGMGTNLIMIGSNAFTGGATPEHFAAQWKDPEVRRELQATGLEHPEQLGALFLAGPDSLKTLTGTTAPLVDDDPKRVFVPFRHGGAKTSALYRSWTAAGDETRERFEADPVVRLWFPAAAVAAASRYFPVQRIIDEHAHRRRPGFDLVHTVLSTTDLRAPVLWLLDSDADIQRIVANRNDDEREAPEASYHLGVGLLSRHDWQGAARALHLAMDDPKWGGRSRLLLVYALAQGGDADAARTAMARARASPAGDAGDEYAQRFWLWYDSVPSLPH